MAYDWNGSRSDGKYDELAASVIIFVVACLLLAFVCLLTVFGG